MSFRSVFLLVVLFCGCHQVTVERFEPVAVETPAVERVAVAETPAETRMAVVAQPAQVGILSVSSVTVEAAEGGIKVEVIGEIGRQPKKTWHSRGTVGTHVNGNVLELRDLNERSEVFSINLDNARESLTIDGVLFTDATAAAEALAPLFFRVGGASALTLSPESLAAGHSIVGEVLDIDASPSDYDYISINGDFSFIDYEGDATYVTLSDSLGPGERTHTYGPFSDQQTLTTTEGDTETFVFNAVTGWQLFNEAALQQSDIYHRISSTFTGPEEITEGVEDGIFYAQLSDSSASLVSYSTPTSAGEAGDRYLRVRTFKEDAGEFYIRLGGSGTRGDVRIRKDGSGFSYAANIAITNPENIEVVSQFQDDLTQTYVIRYSGIASANSFTVFVEAPSVASEGVLRIADWDMDYHFSSATGVLVDGASGVFKVGDRHTEPTPIATTTIVTGHNLTQTGEDGEGLTLLVQFTDAANAHTWQTIRVDVETMLARAEADPNNATSDHSGEIFGTGFIRIDVIDASTGSLRFVDSGRQVSYTWSELYVVGEELPAIIPVSDFTAFTTTGAFQNVGDPDPLFTNEDGAKVFIQYGDGNRDCFTFLDGIARAERRGLAVNDIEVQIVDGQISIRDLANASGIARAWYQLPVKAIGVGGGGGGEPAYLVEEQCYDAPIEALFTGEDAEESNGDMQVVGGAVAPNAAPLRLTNGEAEPIQINAIRIRFGANGFTGNGLLTIGGVTYEETAQEDLIQNYGTIVFSPVADPLVVQPGDSFTSQGNWGATIGPFQGPVLSRNTTSSPFGTGDQARASINYTVGVSIVERQIVRTFSDGEVQASKEGETTVIDVSDGIPADWMLRSKAEGIRARYELIATAGTGQSAGDDDFPFSEGSQTHFSRLVTDNGNNTFTITTELNPILIVADTRTFGSTGTVNRVSYLHEVGTPNGTRIEGSTDGRFGNALPDIQTTALIPPLTEITIDVRSVSSGGSQRLIAGASIDFTEQSIPTVYPSSDPTTYINAAGDPFEVLEYSDGTFTTIDKNREYIVGLQSLPPDFVEFTELAPSLTNEQAFPNFFYQDVNSFIVNSQQNVNGQTLTWELFIDGVDYELSNVTTVNGNDVVSGTATLVSQQQPDGTFNHRITGDQPVAAFQPIRIRGTVTAGGLATGGGAGTEPDYIQFYSN